MSIKEDKRIKFLDVTKGIGIILVVIGHICNNKSVTGIIYQFHMPLFFFISGYLFRIKKDEKSNFYTKLKQLGIPYLSFLFIISTFQFYRNFYSGETVVSFKNIALFISRVLLGGRWLSSDATVFWFVSVLLLVNILMNYLIQRVSSLKIKVLMLIFILFSYINSIYFQNIRIPLNANVILAACPIFYIGYVLKNYSLNKFIYPCLMLILLTFFIDYNDKLPSIDYKNSLYGMPIFSLIISLSFIIFTLKISSALCNNSKHLTNFFTKIGKASLIIMFLHQIIQIYCNIYINENIFIRVFLSILIPYIVYYFASKNRLGRILFIGSSKEFDVIIKNKID
nr:acyltransferase family protein [uncultured Flavobacterium sp.]